MKKRLLSLFFCAPLHASAWPNPPTQLPNEFWSRLFLKANECAPDYSLYYDLYSARSVRYVMENSGFQFLRNREWVTDFAPPRGHTFAGLPVVEVSIPNAEMSIYSVTLSATANDTVAAVQRRTGKKLPVLRANQKAPNSKPYVTENKRSQAMIVCFSFEEGL
jgi:hypothetical protein